MNKGLTSFTQSALPLKNEDGHHSALMLIQSSVYVVVSLLSTKKETK